jgi:hypothetical protein
MKTVVVGLILIFVLFTRPGRLIGVVLLVVAFVGLLALYVDTTAWAHQPLLSETEAGAVGFVFSVLIFGSLFVQFITAFVRTIRERRERAARLRVLHNMAVARHFALQPLDGEILPPQRYLSP